jgi:hypothetical protein
MIWQPNVPILKILPRYKVKYKTVTISLNLVSATIFSIRNPGTPAYKLNLPIS